MFSTPVPACDRLDHFMLLMRASIDELDHLRMNSVEILPDIGCVRFIGDDEGVSYFSQYRMTADVGSISVWLTNAVKNRSFAMPFSNKR